MKDKRIPVARLAKRRSPFLRAPKGLHIHISLSLSIYIYIMCTHI